MEHPLQKAWHSHPNMYVARSYWDARTFENKSVFEDEEFVSNEDTIATTISEIKANNGKDVARVMIVEK